MPALFPQPVGDSALGAGRLGGQAAHCTKGSWWGWDCLSFIRILAQPRSEYCTGSNKPTITLTQDVRIPLSAGHRLRGPWGGLSPYRGQCSNRFLYLGEDHMTVDVSGRTLVEHLSPRAREKRDSSGMESAPPAPTSVTETPSCRVCPLVARSGSPQAHLLSHASTAGSPASTACKTSRTVSSSQLMVAGSFQRKCDRPRYRLTSWLRAGGWLQEGRACKQPPRVQASKHLQAPVWVSRACLQPKQEGCPMETRHCPGWGAQLHKVLNRNVK